MTFKFISWSPNEAITESKMNTMANNDTWLRDNMVTGRYSNSGTNRHTSTVVVSGMAAIPAANKAFASKAIKFNQVFSTGCRPIVTASVITEKQRRVWLTIDGLAGGKFPNNIGFQAHVMVDADKKAERKIKKGMYVQYLAMGY